MGTQISPHILTAIGLSNSDGLHDTGTIAAAILTPSGLGCRHIAAWPAGSRPDRLAVRAVKRGDPSVFMLIFTLKVFLTLASGRELQRENSQKF